MTGGNQIRVVPAGIGQLAGAPLAPVPTPYPDSVGGASPADGAAAALGAAGNLGVPSDAAASAQADLDRRAHAADAAAKFPANEANAAQQFQAVGAQGSTQMVQQLASGIAGAVGGAVGGILKPLAELPQQAVQAGQGAIQPLLSAVQQAHSVGALESADDASLLDSLGADPGLDAGGGAGDIGSGGGGLGDTTPAGYLGPPPVPASSPPTTPAGAPPKSVPVTPAGGTRPASAPMGMTGMPMVPPGAMAAGGEASSKEKPAEKRVTAPGVPNGQPVKGRLTIPPSAPVTKPGEGKPTVVTNRPNRRIVIMPTDDEAKE